MKITTLCFHNIRLSLRHFEVFRITQTRQMIIYQIRKKGEFTILAANFVVTTLQIYVNAVGYLRFADKKGFDHLRMAD